jgi:DNA-3-methyladenine glycosylase
LADSLWYRTSMSPSSVNPKALKAAQHLVADESLPLSRQRLLAPAQVAATRLLGAILEHDTPWGTVRGRIVETEAYAQHDAASHSCRGITPRTRPMFGAPGHAYIYRSYGIHLCMNITCSKEGFGAAVLVRALEPLTGLEVMAQLRGLSLAQKSSRAATIRKLCQGPGNLTRALGLTLDQSGVDLLGPDGPLRLLVGGAVPAKNRAQTGRIGISVAQEVPWRFFERGSPFVSASRRA